jgi:hypothetical protein
MQERDGRHSQQNQRRRYGHQQKMLRHMSCQELMVQIPQRRPYSDPHENDSTDKRYKAPRR